MPNTAKPTRPATSASTNPAPTATQSTAVESTATQLTAVQSTAVASTAVASTAVELTAVELTSPLSAELPTSPPPSSGAAKTSAATPIAATPIAAAARSASRSASASRGDIRPHRVEIPQAALDDLADRLRRSLWPNELTGVGGTYGMTTERVRALAERWLDGFDWRAVEARLNSYPQFRTEIDGEDIHFLHVRSSRPDATALVLTHGWPGSVVEYLDVIAPLTEPDDPDAPAFHLVIPSLPGFGFSGPTRSVGWNRHRTARAWAELMRRLGYDRYGAVGNDAGSMIAPELGRIDLEHVVGVHVTQLFSFPSGDPAEFAGLSESDQAALGHLKWFYDEMFSFNALHSQQPQTLAFALADSPVGLLAWNAQLFGESLDADFILSNVAIYWLTGTSGSAIRFYYEDAHAAQESSTPDATLPTTSATTSAATTTPTALAMFAGDFQSIRRFAERDHSNIVSWNYYDPGLPTGGPRDAAGHYAAHEAPAVLCADIQEFFAKLR